MPQMKNAPVSVDAYIKSFPADIQVVLQQVREIITGAAPGVTEEISYAMPAYKMGGKPVVYFAGYKSHIGFYATPTGHSAFEKQLAKYKQGKGSVQFPLSEAMPEKLIAAITRFRVKEVKAKLKQ
jgi:uncharacterized protein YdhG (YjbR/CyaY superfamily)